MRKCSQLQIEGLPSHPRHLVFVLQALLEVIMVLRFSKYRTSSSWQPIQSWSSFIFNNLYYLMQISNIYIPDKNLRRTLLLTIFSSLESNHFCIPVVLKNVDNDLKHKDISRLLLCFSCGNFPSSHWVLQKSLSSVHTCLLKHLTIFVDIWNISLWLKVTAEDGFSIYIYPTESKCHIDLTSSFFRWFFADCIKFDSYSHFNTLFF